MAKGAEAGAIAIRASLEAPSFSTEELPNRNRAPESERPPVESPSTMQEASREVPPTRTLTEGVSVVSGAPAAPVEGARGPIPGHPAIKGEVSGANKCGHPSCAGCAVRPLTRQGEGFTLCP